MSDRDLVLLSAPIVLSVVTSGRLSPAERGSANVLIVPGPDRSLGASTDEILAKGARGTRSLLSDSRSVLFMLSVVLLYLVLALL